MFDLRTLGVHWSEEEMLDRLKRKRGSPDGSMTSTASLMPSTALAKRTRAIKEEFSLPALQCQLSTVLSNGSALRNSLASQNTIISLENELRTVKSKLDLAVKTQLTAEEKLKSTNLELEAEREKNKMLSGKIVELEGWVAELSEELGDTAVYYTWRTRARIMKQYLEGQTSSWTPKEDVEQFITFVGKPEDLHLDDGHLRDEVKEASGGHADVDATRDEIVVLQDKALKTKNLGDGEPPKGTAEGDGLTLTERKAKMFEIRRKRKEEEKESKLLRRLGLEPRDPLRWGVKSD